MAGTGRLVLRSVGLMNFSKIRSKMRSHRWALVNCSAVVRMFCRNALASASWLLILLPLEWLRFEVDPIFRPVAG